MMTVNEVSRLTGVSIRALHYYDQIGLLKPGRVAENGGRRRSVSRWDPRGLSGQELADIRRRVMEGEKIRF